MHIVAVIPARNEAETVANVVQTALAHPKIKRVIVSDSASTDDTGKRAKEAGAEVVHVNVSGKGQAMSMAIHYIEDATHFLFLDADLLGLTTKSISSIISLLPKSGMSIGIQDRGWFLNFFSHRIFPWISGQRVVPRELWEAIPVELKEGYRVETAMNFFARKFGMETHVCILSGVGALLQEKKRSGIVSGLRGRYFLITEVLTTMVLLRLLYWADLRKDILARRKLKNIQ